MMRHFFFLMIRQPPKSTQGRSSAASDVYKRQVKNDYELNTGKVIAERLGELDPLVVPSVLVHGHGPFCWGADAAAAVYNAVALEEIAKMALCTPCLLYTSPSPRDRTRSRMPSSA